MVSCYHKFLTYCIHNGKAERASTRIGLSPIVGFLPESCALKDELTSPLSKSSTRTIRFAALAGAMAAAFVAQPALAETMGVTATVTKNCTLSTTAVAFGSSVNVLSSTATTANGGISVTCNSGTAWAVSADKGGGGTTASITTRKMASGTNLLSYKLFTDAALSVVWGNGTEGSTIAGTGDGAAQARTIYGQIPTGQTTVPAGAYSDTVNVTVTF